MTRKQKSDEELAKEACDTCGVTPTSDMRIHAEHIAMYAIRQAKIDALEKLRKKWMSERAKVEAMSRAHAIATLRRLSGG